MEQVDKVSERYSYKNPTALREHVSGQIIGMIKAFKMAGMLDSKDDLLTECLEEM